MKIAAHLLETAKMDMKFADVNFVVAVNDKKINLMQVHKTSYKPGGVPGAIEPGLRPSPSEKVTS